jgi:hypothetical protein
MRVRPLLQPRKQERAREAWRQSATEREKSVAHQGRFDLLPSDRSLRIHLYLPPGKGIKVLRKGMTERRKGIKQPRKGINGPRK